MSTEEFEDIGAIGGTFVKWDDVGDFVQGPIVAFGVEAGTDFNGNPVPQIVLGTDDGNVIINGSQANLRRKLQDGAPKLTVGRICRVTWSGTYEAPKGTGKEFTVQVRDAKPGEVAPTPAPVVEDDDF